MPMPVRMVSRTYLGVMVAALAAGLVLVDPAGVRASPELPGSASAASTSAPAAADGPVIGAVGDMACDPSDSHFQGGQGTVSACAQERVSSAMLADTSLEAILGLGDYQYDCGDPADYDVSYNPTWGRLDALMNPVAGNHEYKTGTDLFGAQCPTDNSTAQSFFTHFGASAHPSSGGHFSIDLGTWHLVGLNGNCGKSGVGGCSASSAQTTWLKQDLAATSQPCVAAFWHQPLFTAASFGGKAYRAWWDVLYAVHADVVLNGHVHNYQRYAPLAPDGSVDVSNGITQYTVGTGGEGFTAFKTRVQPQPVVYRRTFGYLRMTLESASWQAEFIDSTGVVLDSSSGTCHSN
jgi:hypothetical protein